MDLYKAIFLSSSDEEEEEDIKKSTVSSNQTQKPEQPTAQKLNVLRNTSPPRGIFANLDFDKLNSVGGDGRQKPQNQICDKGKTSPPRGIFSNLDMTNNQHRNNDSNKQPSETTDKAVKDNSASVIETIVPVQDNSAMYGPSLPKNIPQLPQRVENMKEESSADEEDWVEMNSAGDSEKCLKLSSSKKKHSKKSHRKSKKHKEKKHKHKKKRK